MAIDVFQSDFERIPVPGGTSDVSSIAPHHSRGLVRSAVLSGMLLSSAGCGSTSPAAAETNARLQKLEREVAQLKAESARSEERCRPIDASVPIQTQFPHAVDFELGRTNLRGGDRIDIKDVRGTHPGFEKGGMYIVRGDYTLGSADEASLLFSVTATQRGEGCTTGNGRETQVIQRGSGTFELVTAVAYQGHPHVSLYVDGNGIGGMYFGKGPYLWK